MEKRYRYICTVQVRPIGAEGLYADVNFPVLLDRSPATHREIWDEWYRMLGSEFQPNVIVKINGKPTLDTHGQLWHGEEM